MPVVYERLERRLDDSQTRMVLVQEPARQASFLGPKGLCLLKSSGNGLQLLAEMHGFLDAMRAHVQRRAGPLAAAVLDRRGSVSRYGQRALRAATEARYAVVQTQAIGCIYCLGVENCRRPVWTSDPVACSPQPTIGSSQHAR